METRNAVHPEHAVLFDTAEMREQFLIQNLFNPDEVKLVYSFFDRLIVGGICPVNPLKLAVDEKVLGASYLLERRELGVINVGAPGTVTVDGDTYDLSPKDGLTLVWAQKNWNFPVRTKTIRPDFILIAHRPT